MTTYFNRRTRSAPRGRARAGFTLTEMLVVITILGILAAVLLPALSATRATARNNTCKNNLRQFGIGLHSYAQNRSDRFCSGAFDWRSDGSVTEIGWVADLVNQGVITGQMTCPENPAQLSMTYNDLLTMDASAPGPCVDWLGTVGGTWPDGTAKVNPCRTISSMPAGGARQAVVFKEIYNRYYNTNYTASWFLVRSQVMLDNTGNLVASPAGCPASISSRNSTRGPLTRQMTEMAAVSSSMIPLLGDGQPAADILLTADVGPHPEGMPLVYPLTNGPVTDPGMGTPSGGATFPAWWSNWSAARQDYRKFGPVHGGGCNILFSDGRVKGFLDEDHDGLMSNGFTPNPANGYSDLTTELPLEEVYSGWTLRAELKGKF